MEESNQASFQNTEKYYRVSDLRDLLDHLVVYDEATGHRYRMELVEEETSRIKQGGLIRNYENMEASINEGLRIALKAPTPDQSIDVILEYLGKYLGGERTYIFERNERGEDDNTYEWVAPGVEPQKEILQNLPPEICAHWYELFRENKHIVIRDLEDIRYQDPLQYENLKRQDIHSLVVVPLYDDGKVIAFYGVDNPAQNLSFEYTSNMLQIMGHFMVSSLKRRNLVNELSKMSYTDPLTHLGNRFALEDYIGKVDRTQSIGVVYCDISGLKRINDEQGHLAGDAIIRTAADCLREVFDGYGLFRVGGDELLAICPEVELTEFETYMDRLREKTKHSGVAVAAGSVWKATASESLDQLMTDAEQKMYQDKEAYYRNQNIERR